MAGEALNNNYASADYVPIEVNDSEHLTRTKNNAYKDLVDACIRYVISDTISTQDYLDKKGFLETPRNEFRLSLNVNLNGQRTRTSANIIINDISAEKYLKEIIILFVAAETNQDNLINIEEDLRCIQNSVAMNRQIKVESLLNVSPIKIVESISVLHPRVLHLDGHGGPGEFYMMGDDGAVPESVPPESLSKLFESVKDELLLVVFDFCASHFHAEDAVNYVRFSIGTKDTVDVEVARTFVQQFYKSFAHNNSLSQSFDQAQSAVILRYGGNNFEASEQNKLFELLSSKGCVPSKFYLCAEEE